MRIAAGRSRSLRERTLGSRNRTVALSLLLGWSALVFAIGAATHASGFFGIFVRPAIEGGVAGGLRWLRARLVTPTRIEIDVAFDDFQKLAFQRERALESGSLFAGEDDYVPAVIRSGSENVKVKLRLKGDSTAHLQGEKWSFRVDVRGEKTILGLMRFSLQHPATRGYLTEWVYHRAMLREGVLALRYEFVDLSINGKPLGVYALEEHFEKQLVEQKRRRDGPILRFDEELMWREIHELATPHGPEAVSGYGFYEASAIDSFKTGQTLADPAARELYLRAVRVLEAFRRGELAVAEVFDAKRLATYFALTDLLGAEHASRWHNLRLYMNPISLRLEPIGFDAECVELVSLSGADALARDKLGRLRIAESPLHERIFGDSEFRKLYMAELERVAEPAYLDALLRDLGPELEKAQGIVNREFPQIVAPVALLRRNQEHVRALLAPPAAIRAHLEGEKNGELALEVGNLQALPVEVLGLESGGTRVDLATPTTLEPRRLGELVRFERVPFALDAAWTPEVIAAAQVRWRMAGTRAEHGATVVPYSPLATRDELIDATRREANLAEHPFVAFDAAAKRAEIRPGSWVLEKDLVVPAGIVLRAGPGTRLDLRRGAKILSRSPLEWRGSEAAPIELGSSDATGQGLVVLSAGGESVLEHVVVRGQHAVEEKGWALTGAVTFYESPVTVLFSVFEANPAEDALNVVRSRARVDQSLFRDTTSDAFDCDFCEVEVTNSRFERLTNDGIDVSGSTARVDNVVVERAGDKGISTGEASDLVATRITVIGANVGMASKDRSTLDARDVTLRGCRFGIAAFQKKPEFGPARVRISGFKSDPPNVPHLIQKGSTAIIDDVELPPSDEQNIREILYAEPPSLAH